MVRLKRTVRLVINPPAAGGKADDSRNGYAGKPPMRGIGHYFEFDAVCTGEPDADTGYLVNIKTIDAAVREAVTPVLTELCRKRPDVEPQTVVADLAARVREKLSPVRLASLTWRLTPTYALEATMPTETDAAPRVHIRQRFDFAAAHRLHCPGLSDEENRELFGRCNNPSGHGHNYQVEPCVAVDPEKNFGLADLERITDDTIIDPFDHTHLNEDTEAFNQDTGVNPSVENIARVFFERLGPAIESEAPAGAAHLVSVTVWETDRTSATYPG